MTSAEHFEQPVHVHVIEPEPPVLAFDDKARDEFLAAWDNKLVVNPWYLGATLLGVGLWVGFLWVVLELVG